MDTRMNKTQLRVQRVLVPFEYEKPVMALRITDWKYCKSFVDEGIIHFSNVDDWRNPEKSKDGQLDFEEGCICSSRVAKEKSEPDRNHIYEKRIGDSFKYFYDSENIYGICFYGILLSSFSEALVTPWNTEQRRLTVSQSYFKDLNPKVTQEVYSATAVEDRAGVVFIYDFWKLLDLIKSKLLEMGCDERDIFVGPVFYNNKRVDYFINMEHPLEYFIKDESYKKQHEFRIIVKANNKDFERHLQKSNGNIKVGSIANIAIVQSYYFKDFELAIEGNHLIFELAIPKKESIEDYDFRTLASLLLQIQLNILPQGKLDEDEKQKATIPILRILQDTYGITYDVERWTFNNITKEQYDQLPTWYKERRPFFPYDDILKEITKTESTKPGN